MIVQLPADRIEARFSAAKAAYNRLLERVVAGDRDPALAGEVELARHELEQAHAALQRACEAAPR